MGEGQREEFLTEQFQRWTRDRLARSVYLTGKLKLRKKNKRKKIFLKTDQSLGTCREETTTT